jgi:hypothetical protein
LKEINERLDKISNLTDHYLIKARTLGHLYFNEFLAAAEIMKSLLTEKEFEFWCDEKALLKQQPFREKTFIQGAVETATARFFGEKFPADFKTEVKLREGSDKDVDCSFKDEGFTFHVEVKCAEFKHRDQSISEDTIKIVVAGRMPDRGKDAKDTLLAAIAEGLAKQNKPQKSSVDIKSMDNNLMDYLTNAQEKFNPTAGDDELNVLLVGCDDANDLQMWFNYLHGSEGLFTDESFSDVSKFNLVDAVVLTNQYHKHYAFFDKQIKDAWTLGNGFNIIFRNPFSLREKIAAFNHFLKILPNYTLELNAYKVPGDAPDYVKQIVRVHDFIKDYLERQHAIMLFAN